eukprot:COSAG01_NODE_16258_length_1254_cov_1.305628_1_plen_350_part_10
MSVFSMCFRNGEGTNDVVAKLCVEGVSVVVEPLLFGTLDGQAGTALVAAWGAVLSLSWEVATKSETAASRGTAEEQILVAMGTLSKVECTAARYAELLPMALQQMADRGDSAIASGAAFSTAFPLIRSGVVCAPVIVGSEEYFSAMLQLIRRIEGQEQLRRSAAWWKERSDVVTLDTVCLQGIYCGLTVPLNLYPVLPTNNAACEELLAEAIHLIQVNMEAKLSRNERMPFAMFSTSCKMIQIAAREQSRHKALLKSGVVDALMFAVANDFPFIGSSLAEYCAGTTVALIGRNEGGLTLSRGTVDKVLLGFHQFFDTTSTHWRVRRCAAAPVKSIVGKAQPIVDMVIADA